MEEDPYVVLGLSGDGAQVTAEELRRAYRKRAFEFHPDKNPNDPSAAEKFLKVQNAYELLSDEKARKAFDDLQIIKKQRQQKQLNRDAKRQKMMQDLQQAEDAHELQRRQKKEEDNANARLRAEIEKMRSRKADHDAAMKAQYAKVKLEKYSWLDETDKQKSLKVTWDSGQYSAQRLKDIFEAFGPVEDVMVLDRKKSKRKGIAVVVMSSVSSMEAATQAQCGDLSNPLLVKPLVYTATADEAHPAMQQQQQQQQQKQKQKQQPDKVAAYQMKEDYVLKKLLRKMESRP